MLITLGGKAGSGKGTIAKLLADQLGYTIIGIGALKRQLAEEMGISISEFNQLGELPENQKNFDLKYETFQKQLKLDEKIILDSRLGFFCQPKAFKVFLTIDDSIAAERIFKDTRVTDQFKTFEEALEITKSRNDDDHKRFLKLYKIDIRDPSNYDLIIDTSDKTPEVIVDLIKESLIQHQDPSKRRKKIPHK